MTKSASELLREVREHLRNVVSLSIPTISVRIADARRWLNATDDNADLAAGLIAALREPGSKQTQTVRCQCGADSGWIPEAGESLTYICKSCREKPEPPEATAPPEPGTIPVDVPPVTVAITGEVPGEPIVNQPRLAICGHIAWRDYETICIEPGCSCSTALSAIPAEPAADAGEVPDTRPSAKEALNDLVGFCQEYDIDLDWLQVRRSVIEFALSKPDADAGLQADFDRAYIDGELSRLRDDLAITQRERVHANGAAGSLRREVQQLREQLSSITAERNESQRLCRLAEADRDNLNTLVASLSTERDELREDRDKHARAQDALQIRVNTLEQQLAKTKTDCAESREEFRNVARVLTAFGWHPQAGEASCWIDRELATLRSAPASVDPCREFVEAISKIADDKYTNSKYERLLERNGISRGAWYNEAKAFLAKHPAPPIAVDVLDECCKLAHALYGSLAIVECSTEASSYAFRFSARKNRGLPSEHRADTLTILLAELQAEQTRRAAEVPSPASDSNPAEDFAKLAAHYDFEWCDEARRIKAALATAEKGDAK